MTEFVPQNSYTKEELIACGKGQLFGWLAVAGAAITAFYMTRLMMMTFFGPSRHLPGVHPHRPGPVMVLPLVVLAIGSVVGGLVLNGWIQGWLSDAVGAEVEPVHVVETGAIAWVTLAVVVCGVVLGVVLYRRPIAQRTPVSRNFFVNAGRNELYADSFNEAVFMRPGQRLCGGLELTDRYVVDGAVTGSAAAAKGASGVLRLLENGYVRSYGALMTFGAVIIGVVMILGRLA